MRAMKTSEEAERKSRDIPATEFCRWPIGENLWYQQESLDEHSHYHINPILHLTGTAIKHFMTYPMHHIGYLQWFTHAYHILICDGVTNTRFSYV